MGAALRPDWFARDLARFIERNLVHLLRWRVASRWTFSSSSHRRRTGPGPARHGGAHLGTGLSQLDTETMKAFNPARWTRLSTMPGALSIRPSLTFPSPRRSPSFWPHSVAVTGRGSTTTRRLVVSASR